MVKISQTGGYITWLNRKGIDNTFIGTTEDGRLFYDFHRYQNYEANILQIFSEHRIIIPNQGILDANKRLKGFPHWWYGINKHPFNKTFIECLKQLYNMVKEGNKHAERDLIQIFSNIEEINKQRNNHANWSDRFYNNLTRNPKTQHKYILDSVRKNHFPPPTSYNIFHKIKRRVSSLKLSSQDFIPPSLQNPSHKTKTKRYKSRHSMSIDDSSKNYSIKKRRLEDSKGGGLKRTKRKSTKRKSTKRKRQIKYKNLKNKRTKKRVNKRKHRGGSGLVSTIVPVGDSLPEMNIGPPEKPITHTGDMPTTPTFIGTNPDNILLGNIKTELENSGKVPYVFIITAHGITLPKEPLLYTQNNSIIVPSKQQQLLPQVPFLEKHISSPGGIVQSILRINHQIYSLEANLKVLIDNHNPKSGNEVFHDRLTQLEVSTNKCVKRSFAADNYIREQSAKESLMNELSRLIEESKKLLKLLNEQSTTTGQVVSIPDKKDMNRRFLDAKFIANQTSLMAGFYLEKRPGQITRPSSHWNKDPATGSKFNYKVFQDETMEGEFVNKLFDFFIEFKTAPDDNIVVYEEDGTLISKFDSIGRSTFKLSEFIQILKLENTIILLQTCSMSLPSQSLPSSPSPPSSPSLPSSPSPPS